MSTVEKIRHLSQWPMRHNVGSAQSSIRGTRRTIEGRVVCRSDLSLSRSDHGTANPLLSGLIHVSRLEVKVSLALTNETGRLAANPPR